jgi:hypothetical protein
MSEWLQRIVVHRHHRGLLAQQRSVRIAVHLHKQRVPEKREETGSTVRSQPSELSTNTLAPSTAQSFNSTASTLSRGALGRCAYASRVRRPAVAQQQQVAASIIITPATNSRQTGGGGIGESWPALKWRGPSNFAGISAYASLGMRILGRSSFNGSPAALSRTRLPRHPSRCC